MPHCFLCLHLFSGFWVVPLLSYPFSFLASPSHPSQLSPSSFLPSLPLPLVASLSPVSFQSLLDSFLEKRLSPCSAPSSLHPLLSSLSSACPSFCPCRIPLGPWVGVGSTLTPLLLVTKPLKPGSLGCQLRVLPSTSQSCRQCASCWLCQAILWAWTDPRAPCTLTTSQPQRCLVSAGFYLEGLRVTGARG